MSLLLVSPHDFDFLRVGSSRNSHINHPIVPVAIPFLVPPFNSDLDYVNLTTHADVSSRGLPCCCFLRS